MCAAQHSRVCSPRLTGRDDRQLPPARLQAISDWRAKLSQRYDPTNPLQNDDQNIIQDDGVTPTLVPSNGYTFDRIPTQVCNGVYTETRSNVET